MAGTVLGLDPVDVLFLAAMPAFAWLLLRAEQSQIGYSPPTMRDEEKLSKKPEFVRFSARHTKAFRLAAVGLMTTAFWTARTTYWPYATIAFGLAGVAVWIFGISWFLAVRLSK